MQLILNELGTSPSETLLDDKKFFVAYKNVGKIKHRFVKGGDLQVVLNSFRCILLLNRIFKIEGFLGNVLKSKIEYLQHVNYGIKNFQIDMKLVIEILRNEIFKHIDDKDITRSLNLMFPDPIKNSACKRWNMFMRWMVVKDNFDSGLWSEFIPTSSLVVILDTHIIDFSFENNIIQDKKINWNAALKITEFFKQFSPENPVKYDFMICHMHKSGTL